jgi:phosphatidate cytidylyltransferase
VLSGVVLIPIVVYIVLFTPPYVILAVSTILTFLALLEFNGLGLHKKRDASFDLLGAFSGASLVPLLFFCGLEAFLPALAGLLFIYYLYGLWSARELSESSLDLSHKVLGLAYLSLPLSFITPLAEFEHGRFWLLFLLLVIWSNDTFAYFAGRKFGRHKLAPVISPKKTVEGAVAGVVGGAIVGLIFAYFTGIGSSPLETIAITIAVGLVGMAGDLAESLLKRGANVKDSGTLIPGHGGVLDRIDSLIFPVPLLYYYLLLRAFHA